MTIFSDNRDDAMSSNAPSKANEHRQKLFGWLSWEMILQTIIFLLGLATAFVHLSDKVDTMATKQTEMNLQMNEMQNGIQSHTNQLTIQQTESADQAAKIKVLFDGHEEDRKVIQEVDKNVGILLDRSKPKTP
jgi:hypothetical protein